MSENASKQDFDEGLVNAIGKDASTELMKEVDKEMKDLTVEQMFDKNLDKIIDLLLKKAMLIVMHETRSDLPIVNGASLLKSLLKEKAETVNSVKLLIEQLLRNMGLVLME